MLSRTLALPRSRDRLLIFHYLGRNHLYPHQFSPNHSAIDLHLGLKGLEVNSCSHPTLYGTLVRQWRHLRLIFATFIWHMVLLKHEQSYNNMSSDDNKKSVVR